KWEPHDVSVGTLRSVSRDVDAFAYQFVFRAIPESRLGTENRVSGVDAAPKRVAIHRGRRKLAQFLVRTAVVERRAGAPISRAAGLIWKAFLLSPRLKELGCSRSLAFLAHGARVSITVGGDQLAGAISYSLAGLPRQYGHEQGLGKPRHDPVRDGPRARGDPKGTEGKRAGDAAGGASVSTERAPPHDNQLLSQSAPLAGASP